MNQGNPVWDAGLRDRSHRVIPAAPGRSNARTCEDQGGVTPTRSCGGYSYKPPFQRGPHPPACVGGMCTSQGDSKYVKQGASHREGAVPRGGVTQVTGRRGRSFLCSSSLCLKFSPAGLAVGLSPGLHGHVRAERGLCSSLRTAAACWGCLPRQAVCASQRCFYRVS